MGIERNKMLRHVTVNEIVHAIHEMMGDDCEYNITYSSPAPMDRPYNGGYYVTINNFPERILLYYADTFYDKLNDYCYRVENNITL
jgi:hypothetical protein